jgi:erythromycin esterase-like protein
VPISFLDFNLASKNKNISKMVSKEQGFTLIGDFYNKAIPKKFQYIPKNLFDGLIYIRETTPYKMQ